MYVQLYACMQVDSTVIKTPPDNLEIALEKDEGKVSVAMHHTVVHYHYPVGIDKGIYSFPINFD